MSGLLANIVTKRIPLCKYKSLNIFNKSMLELIEIQSIYYNVFLLTFKPPNQSDKVGNSVLMLNRFVHLLIVFRRLSCIAIIKTIYKL